MTATTGMEAPGMAKVQKSLLINEELVRLLDLHAKRSGASFTRQITAAVLQYLFDRPEGPDPLWMERAVDLDDGSLSLDGVLQDRESEAQAEVDYMLNLVVEPHPRKNLPIDTLTGDAFANELVDRYQRAANAWAAMREPAKMSPILRITRSWKGQHSPPETTDS